MNIVENADSIEIKDKENIFIDKINNLIQTKKHTLRFNEISNIDYSFIKGSYTGGDDPDIFNIKIIVKNKPSIWVCSYYDDPERSRLFANKLCTILGVKLNEEMDEKFKVKCNSCGKKISKISKHCIYCGIKKT